MKTRYKENFDRVVDRYRKLWNRQMKDQILCKLSVRDGEIPRDSFMRNLPDYKKMYEDYIEIWETTTRMKDDTLPVVGPCFGDGIFGGFLGGKVTYESETAWVDHFLKNYDDISSFKYDPNNEYVQLMKDAFLYYQKQAKENLAVAAPLIANPGDLAYTIRGSDLLTDFYDRPEEVHALMDVLTTFCTECKEDFWKLGGEYEEGVFYSWMNWWITGKAVSLTGDVFCLCSDEVFRDFGLPYYQRMADHFGSGWYHMHNLGMHLLPEIVKLKNLTMIEISDDPNVKDRGFDILDWTREHAGDIPLQITCRPEEFIKGLTDKTLPGNIVYVVCNDDYQDIDDMSVDQANDLMEKVWEYRIS